MRRSLRIATAENAECLLGASLADAAEEKTTLRPPRLQSLRPLRKQRVTGTLRPLRLQGQAALETTVALVGAVLLLFASVKVFLWISERLIRRQQYYNCTRTMSASQPGLWDERADPANRISLSFFHAQAISPNPCGP